MSWWECGILKQWGAHNTSSSRWAQKNKSTSIRRKLQNTKQHCITQWLTIRQENKDSIMTLTLTDRMGIPHQRTTVLATPALVCEKEASNTLQNTRHSPQRENRHPQSQAPRPWTPPMTPSTFRLTRSIPPQDERMTRRWVASITWATKLLLKARRRAMEKTLMTRRSQEGASRKTLKTWLQSTQMS